MNKILTYLLILTVFNGFGQRYFHDFPYYDFIKYDSNEVIFKGDSSQFDRFYSKLDKAIFDGKGQVNILHFGGSHVQAGIWSGKVRQRMHQLYPGIIAGRGLMFPYNVGRTTNPSDYRTKYHGYWKGCRNVERKKACLLGLMGISITTSDSTAWLQVYDKPGHQIDYSFTRVKVFHSMDSSSYHMVFPQDTNAIITHFPDKGYSDVQFSKPLDTLHLSLKKTHPKQSKFVCYGFKMENNTPGIYYDAVGNNGADIPAYLRCDLLEEHLSASPPDLVILSIGINDAYTTNFNKEGYKENYRELIKRIRTVSPDCAILFTTNNDSYYRKRYANKNGIKVKVAMEELSTELGAGIWDMFTIMGGLKSIDLWVYEGIAKRDRIHFNRKGYNIMGDLLSSALIKSYDRHLQLNMK